MNALQSDAAASVGILLAVYLDILQYVRMLSIRQHKLHLHLPFLRFEYYLLPSCTPLVASLVVRTSSTFGRIYIYR
jgi:hypothetical protein